MITPQNISMPSQSILTSNEMRIRDQTPNERDMKEHEIDSKI